jgi:hypothetical protein
MEKTKEKRGRKPISNEAERKVQLPIYLKKGTIQKLGGWSEAKVKLINWAESI